MRVVLDVRIITNELFMKTKVNIDKKSQKRILELSNEELIKVAFIESPKYREEFVELAKVEVKKKGLAEIPVKHCPNCGYNLK